MEDIKAKQQKLPIDRVAEKNIYEELKAQYDSAKQTGYGYRHESDLDAIFSRQAGILAAGGLKSVYDIGTRPAERSSVIEVGSRRPDYQYEEPKGTINNVYKRGNDYYYEAGDDEGAPFPIKIDPARILDVQEDVKTRRQSGEDESDYVYYSGIKIQVKDDPRIEVINKRTNAPVYDVELNYDKWQEDPLAYKLLDKPMEVETNPYRGFNKINTNYSVRGAADLSFQMVPDAQGNQVPLILPIYRSTSTDLTPLIIAGTLLAGGLYFGPSATAGAAGTGAATGATAGTAAGATAGTAGTGAAAGAGAATGATLATSTAIPGSFQAALPGLGVSTAATTAASTAIPGTFSAALPGLLSASAGGAPIYFADAVPANELAYPVREVAANYTPVPGSFQEALPGLGVETAASAAPFTAAPGSFQAALPSLLAPAATSGIGLTDALRAANSVNNLLNRPNIQQQTGLPQSGLLGGGQARGVDFSPLYQNSMVGLLPLAERYRRSLI
jgi:hypothetical protein